MSDPSPLENKPAAENTSNNDQHQTAERNRPETEANSAGSNSQILVDVPKFGKVRFPANRIVPFALGAGLVVSSYEGNVWLAMVLGILLILQQYVAHAARRMSNRKPFNNVVVGKPFEVEIECFDQKPEISSTCTEQSSDQGCDNGETSQKSRPKG